jgi:hypothetical protein
MVYSDPIVLKYGVASIEYVPAFISNLSEILIVPFCKFETTSCITYILKIILLNNL